MQVINVDRYVLIDILDDTYNQTHWNSCIWKPRRRGSLKKY